MLFDAPMDYFLGLGQGSLYVLVSTRIAGVDPGFFLLGGPLEKIGKILKNMYKILKKLEKIMRNWKNRQNFVQWRGGG